MSEYRTQQTNAIAFSSGMRLYWDALRGSPWIERGPVPDEVFELGMVASVGFSGVTLCLFSPRPRMVDLY